MEMSESQKEKVHIISDGYRYRKDRVYTDGGVLWRCCKRDCRGRMKVTTEDARTMISEHNHTRGANFLRWYSGMILGKMK